MTRLLSVACLVAVGLSLVSCKDSQACEEGRMKMAKTWGKVKDTAGARALPSEDDELTDAQKAERKRVWTAIQEHAYLVEGSFKTPQITWAAADKGRADLQAAYQNVPNKEDPLVGGFGQMVVEANAEYETFKKNCR
jgi:hypothetical protein